MDKILHIIPFAHNGGTETNCCYFMQFDLQSEHHLIVLGDKGAISTRFEKYAHTVVYLSVLSLGIRRLKAMLSKVLVDYDTSRVIYWSNIHMPIIRSVLSKTTKLAVHVGNPIQHSRKILLKNKVLDLLYPSSVSTTSFACSKYVESTIANDSYYNKFPSTYIHNPSAPVEFNPYLKKRKKLDSEINVGMIARLNSIKDHRTLIKSITRVHTQNLNIKLHLVGDGELRSELEKLVKELNITKDVIFHGNQDNVYEYLQKWDVFVFSTTMNEGLGNVVLEALANGLPVILSDLPMLREIIEDNEAGVFFEARNEDDLAKQIINVLCTEGKCKRMSEAAYNLFNERFHPSRYINALKLIFER